MRIAVSGLHFMGKGNFINDFIKVYHEYIDEIEPYYESVQKLLETKSIPESLPQNNLTMPKKFLEHRFALSGNGPLFRHKFHFTA